MAFFQEIKITSDVVSRLQLLNGAGTEINNLSIGLMCGFSLVAAGLLWRLGHWMGKRNEEYYKRNPDSRFCQGARVETPDEHDKKFRNPAG